MTGVWLAIGLLGLSATGLTWSRYAGANFGEALDSLRSGTPGVSTTLTAAKGSAAAKSADPSAIDGVLKAARGDGLSGTVEIAVPADGTTAWTVTQTRNLWPVGRDSVAVDAATDTVVDRVNFADWPVLAKLTRWGINAHMGTLFGIVNQIALALVAVGLICAILWGYRMWWQRRPTRADRRAFVGTPARPGRLARPALQDRGDRHRRSGRGRLGDPAVRHPARHLPGRGPRSRRHQAPPYAQFAYGRDHLRRLTGTTGTSPGRPLRRRRIRRRSRCRLQASVPSSGRAALARRGGDRADPTPLG